MRYRIGIGGFINDKSVYIQDYQHFNGNQIIFASEYLNSFQVAPYYANSTTAGFYAIGHLEHHFNGLLTNKIPFFRRLNWHLVGGANAFFVNGDNNYAKEFLGYNANNKIAYGFTDDNSVHGKIISSTLGNNMANAAKIPKTAPEASINRYGAPLAALGDKV